ncbi:MobF family relaxase [Streptomyces sp. NPDC004647]|uniref:MobF family relaxase n=1 Tax=Streptomyces sp. NPDC004647 TaxID=3154671 RepID=UPI0033B1F5B0
MTVKPLSAGEGYRYYLRSIAAADGARGSTAAPSSSVPGVPAGVWRGQAARDLGLSGTVTEPQMRSLFGLGMHPEATRIIADQQAAGASRTQALKAAKLGPAVPQLAELSPLDKEIERVLEGASQQLCRPLSKAETQSLRMRTAAAVFEEEYHRAPADGAELGRFLAARTGPQRQPRTAYDLTFSSEELSQLFALGDATVRRVVIEVHEQAIEEALSWLESNALAVRSGPGGIAQHRAVGGLICARYRHYESRAGDPMLHDHAVISARVKGPDGRWRNLDTRLLFREVVGASELYNQRSLELICARLGLRSEAVEVTPGQRPVMRIAGIDPRLRVLFSQRGSAVRIRAEELFEDYRRRHGRQPGTSARHALLERARSSTRPAKRKARSLDELLERWRARAIAATSPATVDALLDSARAAAGALPAAGADLHVDAAAALVLAEVAGRRATFHRRHVLAEARRYLMRTLAGATAPPALADAITDTALAGPDCLDITPPEINPPHPDLQRPDGSSIYRPIGSRTYTTRTLLAAEDALLAASRTLVIPPVPRSTFNRVAALYRGPLDTGQRALARSFCLSEHLLTTGLGPAGAGKTTAMRLVAKTMDATTRRLIPLAPSSRAAKVLGTDLKRDAHTLHAWLHQRDRAAQGKHTPKGFRLRPGDVVLVDEAGMAGTLMLQRVLRDAAAHGAHVRLLGDPHQLAAVESGGALRLLARASGAVELDRLHRFRTDGEAEASLVLRDGDDPRAAFAWYLAKGRIVAGTYEAMCDEVFTAWARDTERGRTSVMTAADTASVGALNARAQAWRMTSGALDTSRSQLLRAGQHAHVGDVICTRQNRRQMIVRRDFVKNGDTWTVQRITPSGDLIVRHTTHRGRIRLPADYVTAQCELGYASTIHRAQGMTVDTSHALASPRSNREGAYVQLTRGARTNRLYVALEDGEHLPDVLAQIASRRRAQLSATETIAALQNQVGAPGQLAAEFTDAGERATTARLTGVLEHTLGTELTARFTAADAFPSLIRVLTDAEREGFDLPRLLIPTASRRGFGDADDASAVLTWRLRERLADAQEAADSTRPRPLALLPLAALGTLADLAAAHRQAAHTELQAADAAATTLPAPVTTRTATTHPAWPDRPHGALTRSELAARTATARRLLHRARRRGDRLLQAAAHHQLAALTTESTLRRALPWRTAAREDWQREPAPGHSRTATQPFPTTRRQMAAAPERQRHARAALARAHAVTEKIAAERRLREQLPDHLPRHLDHTGEVPDWVADRTALRHPHTPEHWRHHLADRHRILTRAIADRGRTLAQAPPAWARPLGPVPPSSAPNRRAAWENTAALVELWRTRHAITGVPGLGPRPDDTHHHGAWEDMALRIRTLAGHRRPTPTPHPDASSKTVLHTALALLDTPPTTLLPVHPAVRDPYGVAPLTHAAKDARLAATALAATLAGEPLPEAWMDSLTAPDEDDDAEQHTYQRLLTTMCDYRRRHHRAGSDPLGPRPPGMDGDAWDHITDAIALYQRARITRRLEDLRARTAAARTAALPTPSPADERPEHGPHHTSNRPQAR